MRKLGALAVFGVVSALSLSARADGPSACTIAEERATSFRNEGRLVESRDALLLCTRNFCDDETRERCACELARTRGDISSVIIHAVDGNGFQLKEVTVRVDGVVYASEINSAAMEIDPGPHVIRFEHAGYPPVGERYLVLQGQKGRILDVVFRLPPEETAPPIEMRRRTDVLGTVGVATATTGGILLALGTLGYALERDRRDDVSPGVLMTGMIGGLLFMTGIGLKIGAELRGRERVHVAPTATANGAGLFATGRF